MTRCESSEKPPGWCPVRDTGWQRWFRLVQNLLQNGGTLPVAAGKVIVQGEDLGGWGAAQRFGWEQLLPARQWLLENVLGIEPAGGRAAGEADTGRHVGGQPGRARQFHAREGHLRVPRKHVEQERTEAGLAGRQEGDDGVVAVEFGTWLDNVHKRADRLTGQRRADLDALGMRW
ncbi:helicase associated domain-containing protein [Streptomyces sp. NPDC057575]|uniref:helicase associated domain-containing protein n=1 Tax=unclassified Streptomyces TaxID=2593676 RepID=UPI0036BCF147